MPTPSEPKPVIQGKIDLPEHQRLLEEAGVVQVKYRYMVHRDTGCWLFYGDGRCIGGLAHLHPRDQFCRRTGRIVALRRAIHALDLKGRRG